MPLPCMDSIVDQPVFQSFRPVQFNMMPALGVRVGLPRPQRSGGQRRRFGGRLGTLGTVAVQALGALL